MKIVCVGAGLAVVRAVDELVRLGCAGTVEIYGAESVAPYDRPPLSKAILRSESEPPALWPAGAPSAVALRLGISAVGVDTTAGRVHLDDGSTVAYDALIIGTGAHSRRVPGLDGRDVHHLRTARDAVSLRDAVSDHGRLTILGGGFIGCEVASSFRALDVAVTVLEREATLLNQPLGPLVGAELTQLHRRHGVDVRCGVSVLGQDAAGLALDDGTVLPPAPVLVSIGAEPSSAWLAGSDVLLDRGAVVCDRRGRATPPRVWAVGDVAAWADGSGLPRRHEHWTSAADQGVAVARDILGQDPVALPLPYFWSDQYDVKIQMLGLAERSDVVEPVTIDGRKLFLYLRDGTLAAAVGLGAPRQLMPLRAAVAARAARAQVPV